MNHEPPDHLDETARAKWAELAPTLDMTKPGTADALAAYCVAYSRWTAAEAKVSELGSVIKSAAGFAIQSPYVAIAAAAQRQMRQWATELKITPKSRGKVTSAEGEESAVSKILKVMDSEAVA